MKLTLQPIFAKQDNPKAMADFLRRIPDGQQFRLDLAPGREYRNDGYARGSMTGYYLQSDGEVVSGLIISNLYAHQHQAVTTYFDARRTGNTALGVKAGLEQALGLELEPDPTWEEIDRAIKLSRQKP